MQRVPMAIIKTPQSHIITGRHLFGAEAGETLTLPSLYTLYIQEPQAQTR